MFLCATLCQIPLWLNTGCLGIWVLLACPVCGIFFWGPIDICLVRKERKEYCGLIFEIAEAWFFVIASICLSSVGYSNCQIIIPWSSLGMQVGLSGSPHIGKKNGLFVDNPACIPSLCCGLIVTKLGYKCWNQLLTRYLSVSFVPLDAFVVHESFWIMNLALYAGISY